MTLSRPWRWIVGATLVVALLLVALIADGNILRRPIEKIVAHRTGRVLTLSGDLRLSLNPHLHIVASDVSYANPGWAAQPEMVRVERVSLSIAWLPLLIGRVVIPEVVLQKPLIDLERREDLSNNWTPAKDEQGTPPEIGRLALDNGLLFVTDVPAQAFLKLKVQTDAQGTTFSATGKYQGQPLEAQVRGDAILSIADTALPYALRGDVRVGPTSAHLEGSITGLAALAAADLDVVVKGDSTADLFALVHLALPPSPPYQIKGHVIREGEWWRMHDFEGRLGDSDLKGSADVAYRNGRAEVRASIESQVLDLDDIAGFVGALPKTGPGQTASAEQKAEKAVAQASPTLLPDVAIRLERLRAMDADVTFKGESIRGRTPVDDMQTHILLKDGVLKFDPLNFGVAGGNVIATLTLDGRGEHAGVDSNIEFRRINMSRLFPESKLIQKSTGVIGGRAVLAGKGDSLADFLGHAHGTLGLAMSGGTVSALVLELAELDLAHVLRLLFTGDKPVTLRCAVADLEVQDGVVRSRSTIVDTTDTNLKIDGQVSFGGEQLDLTIHPLPKDYSLKALRSPLHVQGTFKHPAVRVDPTLVVRGGLGAILGAIASPVVKLAGLIAPKSGDNAECEHLIQAVEQHVQQTVPEAKRPPVPQPPAAPAPRR